LLLIFIFYVAATLSAFSGLYFKIPLIGDIAEKLVNVIAKNSLER